jgi:quercetin dioxygenase-like cupin family protein
MFQPTDKVNFVNRTEFEATLRAEGFEFREGEILPNHHTVPHTHDFDARLFVLDGSITIVSGDAQILYLPGDSYALPAGTVHAEHTGDEGVRYVAGRRSVAQAEAAE